MISVLRYEEYNPTPTLPRHHWLADHTMRFTLVVDATG